MKGKVLPVTLDRADIHAVLEDGSEIVGETNIDIPKHDGNLRIERLYLSPKATVFPEAAEAVRSADVVVFGPGDLYTSVIPNFLVEGMNEALQESKAKKIVVCNLMTKWGETHGFVASDMIKELLRYTGLSRFDYIICNTGIPSPKLVTAYEAEKKYPMVCDEELSQYGQVVQGDFFSEADIARHDAEKLAKVIVEL